NEMRQRPIQLEAFQRRIEGRACNPRCLGIGPKSLKPCSKALLDRALISDNIRRCGLRLVGSFGSPHRRQRRDERKGEADSYPQLQGTALGHRRPIVQTAIWPLLLALKRRAERAASASGCNSRFII